ncbi:DNA mismatch repair protein [Ancylostoma caninum]|uniref:DNA mismatch repair protein n=1 Tax=Ancylostoma caninum TaxID=29170 RepID=A0A368FXV7_ANCCA|nr:DNA mismatch repair protein [Ancylostoma caninum]
MELMSSGDVTKKEVYRIESDVSARISTAQVIVSLSGAVRQLIDNSLDASAQSVEIRAKNNGFESVEVIDDGTGIGADSFASLCKPHSTSKLTGINDFSTLSTLGFRGEALNALCALASLTVITRDRSASVGSKLRFDHSGNIVDQSSVARSIGTTVLVENLFETLPVRRKEYEKTAKKEFGRLLTAVQSFALSRPDVKFICSNTVAGKKVQPVCTPGKATVREVVLNLFGGRTDKNKMVDVVRCLPTDEVASIHGVDPKNTSAYDDIEMNGFVSSCEHGFGRSSADRQFIYVNQRPVDYPKICRVINEVYQQYNRSQYPTLVLYIGVPPGEIDVNVTPDKRMVFFEREKELLALIRSSFLATFHPLLGSYTSVGDKVTNTDFEDTHRSTTPLSKPNTPLSAQSALISFLKSNSAKAQSPTFAPPQPKRCRTEDHPTKTPLAGIKTIEDFAFKPISRNMLAEEVNTPPSTSGVASTTNGDRNSSTPPSSSSKKKHVKERSPSNNKSSDAFAELTNQRRTFNPQLTKNLSRGFELDIGKDTAAIEKMERTMDQEDPCTSTGELPESDSNEHLQDVTPSQCVQRSTTFFRTQQTMPFSMKALKDRLNRIKSKTKEEQASQIIEFTASIAPGENTLAEEELDRILKKTDFAQMSVIGQFNKGFIITRLRDHLFLVDQHASDEKYNFERFQKKARVETQKLLHPKHLDLGAVQESALKDNLDVLEANGFGFEFQEKEDGCSIALLTSTPVLHSWQFDKSDIEEILSVVSEFPGVMYRPAKLRRIFASRACRKSVMIGTALTTSQMQTIVTHLGTLDQPWNCPHGRPTLRHLVDLRKVTPQSSVQS